MEKTPIEIKANQVYSVIEVAEVLKVHPQTVTMYCRTKQLKAKRLRQYRILGQSVIDFLNDNSGSDFDE